MSFDMEMDEYHDEKRLRGKGMKCLVIGGAGFIGSSVVRKLIKDNHYVEVLDNLSEGKLSNVPNGVVVHEEDIRGELYDNIFENVDIVFHLAAFTKVDPSIKEPIDSHNINVNGTLNVLEACRLHNVKRVVFSSSSAVYGNPPQLPTTEECPLNPISPYALHKLIGEQYCKLYSEIYGMETVCLRYSNVYGDNQPNEGAYCNVSGIFTRQRLNNEKMSIVGDGNQRRDFINVEDVATANVKVGVMETKWNGDVINIGYNKNYSVNDIADMIGGDTVNVEDRIEPRESLLDVSKAKFLLDFEPKVKLEDWIKSYKEKLGL